MSKLPARKMPELDVRRIRIDANGYDRGGSYWGEGPWGEGQDVFIVATHDRSEEITVRAVSMAEAKAKAASVFAGSGASERIEGKARHITRAETSWRNDITGETVRLRVIHSRDDLAVGTDHLEFEVIAPPRAALPITDTGYRSHFLPADEIARAGGPLPLVADWLGSTAALAPWRRAQQAAAQGDLFSWADAKDETAGRRKAGPKRPKARVAKRRTCKRGPA